MQDCFLAVLPQNANDEDKEKQSFPATTDSKKQDIIWQNLIGPNRSPKKNVNCLLLPARP